MTRKEAILAMLDGKEVTSDEFEYPDITYCTFDDTKSYPFKYCYGDGHGNSYEESLFLERSPKTWRLRNYAPKDKDLVWAWDDTYHTEIVLGYYDAKNRGLFSSAGTRRFRMYGNYAPFEGTPPPNICKKEDLED